MLRRNASMHAVMLSIQELSRTGLQQNQAHELLYVHPFVGDQFPLNVVQNLVLYAQDELNLRLPNLRENALVVMTFRHLCDVRQYDP